MTTEPGGKIVISTILYQEKFTSAKICDKTSFVKCLHYFLLLIMFIKQSL